MKNTMISTAMALVFTAGTFAQTDKYIITTVADQITAQLSSPRSAVVDSAGTCKSRTGIWSGGWAWMEVCSSSPDCARSEEASSRLSQECREAASPATAVPPLPRGLTHHLESFSERDYQHDGGHGEVRIQRR
jgi:hypothetical protein